MGMSLRYESRHAVSAATRIKIEADVAGIERDWWCEDLSFFSDEIDRLVGSTKLRLHSYSTSEPPGYVEVDGDESSFMAGWDALFIISCLCRWSKQSQITWDLTYGGEPAGTIQNGDVHDAVRNFVAYFDRHTPLKLHDAKAAQYAIEISAKYASRNE